MHWKNEKKMLSLSDAEQKDGPKTTYVDSHTETSSALLNDFRKGVTSTSSLTGITLSQIASKSRN